MVRETSYEAYRDLVNSGTIAKKRGEALLYVATHPDCTALECDEYYNQDAAFKHCKTLHQRFPELQRLGYIEETGTKLYRKKMRITYRVTGYLCPTPMRKKLTPKQKFDILYQVCKDVVANTSIPSEIRGLVRANLEAVSDMPGPALPDDTEIGNGGAKKQAPPSYGGVLDLW